MKAARATFRSRLGALFGVEPGEGRALGLAVGLYFLLACSFVFVQTTAYGLFMEEFGARNLPFAYVSIALLASVLAYAYLKLSERLSFRTLAFADLGFLAAVCAVFWLGLQTGLSHWFVFLLPFWFQALINLANLIVWPLAGRLFDVRQAKRLFGLVGGGSWLANILLGGFIVTPLLALVGPAELYLFAAVFILAAGFLLWRAFRSQLVPATTLPGELHRSQNTGRPAASPFRSPYNRLIFAYVLLWWLSFYFIDNIFYDRAGAMFPDAAGLAAFLGKQLSVIGVIALIMAILLTGRIVRRFGVRTALLAMPLIVLVCSALLAVSGLVGAPASVMFWIATVEKTLNVALGFSLSLAAGTLLYQPILGNERSRTQTIAEGIVQPLAIGAAGMLLLLLNTALHFTAAQLSAVFLVIGGVWLWVIFQLARHYPRVLSQALVKRSLGEATTLLFDPAGIALLEASLKSADAGRVLYALNQLEQLEPDAWRGSLWASLPGLLSHPTPAVREYTLLRLHAHRHIQAVLAVRDRLAAESDIRSRAAALRFLAACEEGLSGPVKAGLDSDERLIRQSAIIGSLESAEPGKVETGTRLVYDLVASAAEPDRLMAAEILAEAECPGSYTVIRRLLSDDSMAVRQMAVRAAGRQPGPGLIEDLVAACDVPETARVAERILAAKGAPVLPAVLPAIARAEGSPASQGMPSLLRLLGVLGGDEAQEALRARMDCADAARRMEVLRSLSAMDYRVRAGARLLPLLQAEVAQAAWLAAAIQSLAVSDGSGTLTILCDALSAAFRDARRRTMLLLSFALDRDAVLRASVVIDEAGDNPPAFAVEAVDAMLPSAWKPLVMPLLEGIPPAERLKRWRAAGIPAPFLSLESIVGALIAPQPTPGPSRWLTVCAVHVAGTSKILSCEPSVRLLALAPDRTISNLACWSLAEMGFDVPVQGGAVMLSLVEKVLALKSASVFRKTPDDVLADVADRVEEVVFDKGETIFRKGDHGDSLYIIVSGSVEVRDGERLLNQLGEGAIFGELALLDPAPRSATITALEPAHLLQLNEAHFRQVLAERPEVATAIIHVLTSYIRNLLASGEAPAANTKDPEIFEP